MDINSVRYDNPNPQPNPWLTVLAGVIQGGAGQIAMNQAKAQQQQDALGKLLPYLAQQNRLNPAAQGAPGSFGFGGQNWSIGAAPMDYGNLYKKAEYDKLNWEMEHPDEAMYRGAGKQMLSDAGAMAATGNSNGLSPEEVLLRAKQAIETMRTGIGPVSQGKPAKPGIFGTPIGAKPATKTTRTRLTKDGIVTEYLGDGGWTSDVPTQQPTGTPAKPSIASSAPAKKRSYTSEQEQFIKTNMNAYKKSREEIVNAMIQKGYLPKD